MSSQVVFGRRNHLAKVLQNCLSFDSFFLQSCRAFFLPPYVLGQQNLLQVVLEELELAINLRGSVGVCLVDLGLHLLMIKKLDGVVVCRHLG